MTTGAQCECDPCCGGAPQKFLVSISGIQNDVCTDCADQNGDFVLERVDGGCTWVYEFDVPNPCNIEAYELMFVRGPDDRLDINLNTRFSGCEWVQTDVNSCLEEEYNLEVHSSAPGTCDYDNSQVVIKPVGIPLDETNVPLADCFFPGAGGCDQLGYDAQIN